jgi:hypothetical protein
LQPVAGGFDDFDIDRMAFVAEQVGNMVSLPESQL